MPTPIPSTPALPPTARTFRLGAPIPHHASLSGASCSPLPRCRPCWRSWQRRPGCPGCAFMALWDRPAAIIALVGIAALAALIRRHRAWPLVPRYRSSRCWAWPGWCGLCSRCWRWRWLRGCEAEALLTIQVLAGLLLPREIFEGQLFDTSIHRIGYSRNTLVGLARLTDHALHHAFSIS